MSADSYYEPPEPTAEDVLRDADQDADSLVAEWASEGEYETWIAVHINARTDAPLFEIQHVAQDGAVLFTTRSGLPGPQFDSIEDTRAWLEKAWPLRSPSPHQ